MASRIVLILLGGLMAWSAVEHWMGSESLGDHYAKTYLGSAGLITVAIIQSIAAIGLFWPRFQPVAGLTVAIVMLVATASRMRATPGAEGLVFPIAIGVWAVVPAIVLLVNNPRQGSA